MVSKSAQSVGPASWPSGLHDTGPRAGDVAHSPGGPWSGYVGAQGSPSSHILMYQTSERGKSVILVGLGLHQASRMLVVHSLSSMAVPPPLHLAFRSFSWGRMAHQVRGAKGCGISGDLLYCTVVSWVSPFWLASRPEHYLWGAVESKLPTDSWIPFVLSGQHDRTITT